MSVVLPLVVERMPVLIQDTKWFGKALSGHIDVVFAIVDLVSGHSAIFARLYLLVGFCVCFPLLYSI